MNHTDSPMPVSNQANPDHAKSDLIKERPTWDSMPKAIKKAPLATRKTQTKYDSKVEFTCDLSKMPMFSTNFGAGAPIPVISAYGVDPAHRYYMRGKNWDYQRIFLDKKTNICRSDRFAGSNGIRWRDMIIAKDDKVFIHLEEGEISVYASDLDTAKNVAINFSDKYSIPAKIDSGCYNLISLSSDGIDTESVPLQDRNKLDEQKMDLFYGEGFSKKNEAFLDFLKNHRSGLSIFEGTPGTGKTSYIRYLIGKLKDTHRFYFIPPASTGVLTNPEFIRFWSRQSTIYNNYRFVCVLEDADGALMTRDLDNRREVGAILNITDGLLADFLKLQVICSINCSSTEIDPALIRPGRLSTHLLFDRMPSWRAQRIAEEIHRELPLQNNYSLAEIFNTPATVLLNKPRIGFAA
jgi:hypothetical protein